MCWEAMSSSILMAVAFGLAVVAAARSTWSPCGISMLSTLTPVGERSRGNRYSVTVGWFLVGAVVGGAALGALSAGLAALVGLSSPSIRVVTILVVVAAAVTIGSDLKIAGLRLPTVPRQVNEVWTGRYRSWVYAAGFGAQIGVGLSTYVMTAAVYLTIVLAAMTGQPLAALLVGVTFGTVRGLAILLGVGLRSPEAIRRFHQRFESLAETSLAIAVAAQITVLAVAAGRYAGPAVVVVAVVGYAVHRLRGPRQHRLGHAEA
jgi:MFS family permease